MKILLATNIDQLDNYIKSLPDFEICDIVRVKKSVLEKTLEYKPEIVVVSHLLSGNESMIDIITKLTSKDYPSCKIVYLYGQDDADRKNFINFLITRSIYNYHIGEELNKQIINDLLFNNRTRDDVKDDVLNNQTTIQNVVIATADVGGDNKTVVKKPTEFIQEYIKDMSDQDKERLGLIQYKNKITKTYLESVIIAVAGADRKDGSTHTAIAIADYLKRYNEDFKVAVLNANESNDLMELVIDPDDFKKAKTDESYEYNYIDFYGNKNSLLDITKLKYYDYIILDLGQLKKWAYENDNEKLIISEHYGEMLRSTLPILVCTTKLWNYKNIKLALYKDANQEDYSDSKNWTLLLNFTDDITYRKLKSELSFRIFKTPYSPQLFNNSEEYDIMLNELLKPVLPEETILENKEKPFLETIFGNIKNKLGI